VTHRRLRGNLRERRSVEAGHHAGRREHRPGRLGAHRRRSAPPRLVAPHRPEHGGPEPHGDLARGRIGATTPIQSGWTGFSNAALVVDPGACAPSRAAFAPPTRATRSGRPTPRSSAAAASWVLQPGQINPTARSRTRATRRRPCARRTARRPAGLRRHARHVGPRGPHAGDAELQLTRASSTATTRNLATDANNPHRYGVVLERERPPRCDRA
jgi:hypothetical protein